MYTSVLTTALLALQGTPFALAGPILKARGEHATPTHEEMKERLEPWDLAGIDYVFYVSPARDAAQAWADARSDSMKAATLWDTDDGELSDESYWHDSEKVRKLWNTVFTEQAQGTAWVFYQDGGKIPTNKDSWYNDIERPILSRRAADKGDPLFEVMQISAANTNEIYQIMPVDVRDHKRCSWHGTAPDCDAKCPSGTVEITRSHYGDDPNSKCSGHGKKVFCCPSANA